MSRLFGSITGILEQLFKNLLLSWRDPVLVSSETTELFELSVLEEKLKEEEEKTVTIRSLMKKEFLIKEKYLVMI